METRNDPHQVMQSFRRAVRRNDAEAGAALSTPRGWGAEQDSARRLFRQAAGSQLDIRPLDEGVVRSERAVLRCALYWPARRRFVGTVWGLLLHDATGWRLEGVTSVKGVAALFVHGRMPALISVRRLPVSPEAFTWGEAEASRRVERALRGVDEVQRVTGWGVIGQVPWSGGDEADAAPRVLVAPDSDRARAVRDVADAIDARRRHTVLLALSARSGEGKTSTLVDLAVVWARRGLRVLLVDGDLHMPRLYRRLPGVQASPGLTTVLEGSLDVERVIQETAVAGLDVLPAGRAVSDATSMLGSVSMARLLRCVSDRYDRVLVDGAPVLEFDDTLALARQIDADRLWVVEADRTTDSVLRAAVERAGGSEPLGVVLNKVSDADDVEATVTVEILGTRYLSCVDRHAVGLAITRSGEAPVRRRWFVLARDVATGRLERVGESTVCTLEALLEGVSLPPLEGDGHEERSMRDDDDDDRGEGKRQVSPEQARELAKAIMAGMGFTIGPDGQPDFSELPEGMKNAQLPEAIYRLFTAAADAAKGGGGAGRVPDDVVDVSPIEHSPSPEPASDVLEPVRGAEVIDLDAEREARRGPTGFERKIQDGLRDAFYRYLDEHHASEADDGAESVEVDLDFLKDHGPALAGSLAKAFFGSVVPEGISFEVGEGASGDSAAASEDEASEADGPEADDATTETGRQVRVHVDLSGFLRGLFGGRAPDES